MTDKTYNGWANYETWLTNLHFENLEFDDYIEEGVFDSLNRDDVKRWIADWIKGYVIEIVFYPFDECSSSSIFLVDVINSFLDEVDWDDIADHYIDDVWEKVKERTENA